MLLIRLIIVGVILLSVRLGHCQVDSFVMVGHIKGVKKGNVQIWKPKSDSTFYLTHDQAPIINGKFTIKGFLKFPRQTALVVFDEGNVVLETQWFYIDPGNQQLQIDSSNNQVKLISTAKTFQEYVQDFKPMADSLRQMRRHIEKLIDRYSSSAQQGQLDSLNRLEQVLRVKKDIFLIEYIMKNPKSYVGVTELSASIDAMHYFSFYEMAYSFLDEQLKQSPVGQETLKKIRLVKQLSEGLKFPSFEMLDSNKHPISLYQKQLTKFTLVDFWFHSCGSCIAQFPDFKKVYEKFNHKGFEIVGITIDKERYEQEWKKAIEKYQLPWPQYWDVNGDNCLKYRIDEFPANFLLNDKGEIIARNIDLKALNVFLNKNL